MKRLWLKSHGRYSLAVTTALVFLLPLAVAPILSRLPFPLRVTQVLAALFSIPVICLADYYLRKSPETAKIAPAGKEGRHITALFRTLLITAGVVLLAVLVTGSSVLLYAAILYVLYLLLTLLAAYLAVPRHPASASPVRKRTVVGNTVIVSVPIESKIGVRLAPQDSWVRVFPQTIASGKTELHLTITLPLAGPARPKLRVSALDVRGLMQVDRFLEPVALEAIPRARYAAWLAARYLEQSRAGANTAATLPPQAAMIPRRGIEYLNSRDYQPGDRLKDIDWKHTLKLGQLIVKEYVEAAGQAAILAVNLAVADADAADKLAFDMISAALTLAQEAIPVALAAYNSRGVIFSSPVGDPREALKRTLQLVKDVEMIEVAHRYLQPADPVRLKRTMGRLKAARSGPAQRLLEVLDFEYRALQKAAQVHPAAAALSFAVEHTPSPAVIVLVSQMNHDAEAVLMTTEKLSRRGFSTIRIDSGSANGGRLFHGDAFGQVAREVDGAASLSRGVVGQ